MSILPTANDENGQPELPPQLSLHESMRSPIIFQEQKTFETFKTGNRQ